MLFCVHNERAGMNHVSFEVPDIDAVFKDHEYLAGSASTSTCGASAGTCWAARSTTTGATRGAACTSAGPTPTGSTRERRQPAVRRRGLPVAMGRAPAGAVHGPRESLISGVGTGLESRSASVPGGCVRGRIPGPASRIGVDRHAQRLRPGIVAEHCHVRRVRAVHGSSQARPSRSVCRNALPAGDGGPWRRRHQ